MQLCLQPACSSVSSQHAALSPASMQLCLQPACSFVSSQQAALSPASMQLCMFLTAILQIRHAVKNHNKRLSLHKTRLEIAMTVMIGKMRLLIQDLRLETLLSWRLHVADLQSDTCKSCKTIMLQCTVWTINLKGLVPHKH